MTKGAREWTTRRGALAWLAAGSIAGVLSPLESRAFAQGGPQGRDSTPGAAVDLHLILAVDASGSVSTSRFALQKQGYIDAFANHRVLEAVRSGPNGAIAVTMFQWTGPTLHAGGLPWMRIADETSIMAFSAAIQNSDRQLFGGGTSISGAIDHALTLFPASPYKGGRRVIDVSGDGFNNRGRPAEKARDEAVAAGININGLPILEVEPYLEEYFRQSVIGGPGAFVVAAATFADFGKAILRKLILEIADRTPDLPGGTDRRVGTRRG